MGSFLGILLVLGIIIIKACTKEGYVRSGLIFFMSNSSFDTTDKLDT